MDLNSSHEDVILLSATWCLTSITTAPSYINLMSPTWDSWGLWNSCKSTYNQAQANWKDKHMSFNWFNLWFMGMELWCETDNQGSGKSVFL